MDNWAAYHQAQPTENVDWAQLAQQWMAMRETEDRRGNSRNPQDFSQNHQAPWHQPRHQAPPPPPHNPHVQLHQHHNQQNNWGGDWTREDQWRGGGSAGPSPGYHPRPPLGMGGPLQTFSPSPRHQSGNETWRGPPGPTGSHFGPPGNFPGIFPGPAANFHGPPIPSGPPVPSCPPVPSGPPKSLFPSAQAPAPKPRPLFASAAAAPQSAFYGCAPNAAAPPASQRPPPQLHFFQDTPRGPAPGPLIQQNDNFEHFEESNHQSNSQDSNSSDVPKGVPPPPPLSGSAPYGTVYGAAGGSSLFTMDKETRKKLPAWILEGLEKAEKEKQKQLEKEEKLRKAEEEKARRRAEAGKSKFDSSSDEEDVKSDDLVKHRNGNDKYEDNGNDSEDDLEERREQFMRCVKSLMMNVLLETSNDAIMRIIQEELREFQKKQSERKSSVPVPKIIGNSSALAALAAFGDGDESESGSSDNEDNSNTSSRSARNDSDGVRAVTEEPSSNKNKGEFKAPVGIPRKFSVKTDTTSPSHHQPDQVVLVDGDDDSRAQDGSKVKKSEKWKGEIEEKERKSAKKNKKRRSRSRSRSRSRERDSSRRHRRSRSRSSERRRKRSRSSEKKRDRETDKDRRSSHSSRR